MTYAQFRNAVTAFTNRTEADLNKNGVDMVLIAANMAKAEAQRRKKFNMSRDRAFISAKADGTDISAFTTLPGSGTAVKVAGIESVWLYSFDGAYYTRARLVKMISSQDIRNYYPVGNSGELNPAPVTQDSSTLVCYVRGTKLYFLGLTNASGVYAMADVFKYMPDYSGTNTDFFLDYHSDWLIAKTVDYLNIFLKEDQRVAISQGKLEATWTSVTAFDDDFAGGSSDDAGLLE
jgi:hypothetical protein